MKIWRLTPRGRRIARVTNSPDTANWRVIHALREIGGADGAGMGTTEQIAIQAGISEGEANAALAILKRKEIVEEV